MIPHAEFPGLDIISFDMVHSRGAEPSQCVCTCVSDDVSVLDGTLTIYDDGVTIAFPESRIRLSNTDFAIARRGDRIQLAIEDRRWKWAGVLISKSFNVRDHDSLVEEATGEEIFGYLLSEVGETGYVIDLPNMDAPTCKWDHTSATEALNFLADYYMAAITLGVDNRIYVTSANYATPSLPVDHIRTDPTTLRDYVPGKIKVVFGPTRYHSSLRLWPAILTHDARIVPIWDVDADGVFDSIGANPWGLPAFTGTTLQTAQMSFMKWFYLGGVEDSSGFYLLDGNRVPTAEHIELDDTLESMKMLDSGGPRAYHPVPLTYYIWGNYWPGTLSGDRDDSRWALMSDGFNVDKERLLVTFERPIVGFASNGVPWYPDMFLYASYRARGEHMEYIRYTYTKNISNKDDTVVIRVDDRWRSVIGNYWNGRRTGISDNKDELDLLAEALCNEYISRLNTFGDVEYAGFLPISPIGRIGAVRWGTGGINTPYTRIYYDTPQPFVL